MKYQNFTCYLVIEMIKLIPHKNLWKNANAILHR